MTSIDDKQKKIFAQMSAEQKLKAAERLYYSARELKAAALRSFNPEWSEEKVLEETKKIFLNARD